MERRNIIIVCNLHLELLRDIRWQNLLLVSAVDEVHVSSIQEGVRKSAGCLLVAKALFSSVGLLVSLEVVERLRVSWLNALNLTSSLVDVNLLRQISWSDNFRLHHTLSIFKLLLCHSEIVHSIAQVLHIDLVAPELCKVNVSESREINLQVIHHLHVLLPRLTSWRRVVKNVVYSVESLLVLLDLDC